MTQKQAGQTGGAIGAGGGAILGSVLAKQSGATGGQQVLAALAGGFGGYQVGQKIGQQNGAPGVYTTTVPNQ